MNRKLNQVMVGVSRASKSHFQGSSSSNRREAMLRCVHGVEEQHGEDEEEEQQRGEEEQGGEEGQHGEEEEEAELERVPRQTQRSHVVAPPIAPAWEEDRVLIRPLGDRYVHI
jgi:hypothetical protein